MLPELLDAPTVILLRPVRPSEPPPLPFPLVRAKGRPSSPPRG